MKRVLIADRPVLHQHQSAHRLTSVEAPRTPDATSATVRDPTLIGRLLAGDHAALADVYDNYGALVYGLARSVSHDEQIARDVTQDVFVHLWEFPDRVDLTRGSLKSYLAVIAHRRAVDAVRRSERHTRTEERIRSQPESVVEASDTEALNESARIWQSERLTALVDDLPPEQGDALRLAYFEGRTYREVAVQLGIPEGTAKSRLRLALARLREQLDHDDRWAWT
jgi:RNA polymerase sigma-70 factor (ECF subfamily)